MATLGGPVIKQFVLQSCFFNELPRHANIMTDKEFNLFDECAARVYICSHREKIAPLLPEGTVKYTHLAA